MKIAFVGQEDYIVGLSNAAKSPIVQENLFDYFNREKPELVVSGEMGFSRSLFKNLLRHKPKFVFVGKYNPEKKFEQLAQKNVSAKFFLYHDIVAFDPIRYGQPKEGVNPKKGSCFITDSDNPYISAKEPTDIYSKQYIYSPYYKGWPTSKEFGDVVRNYEMAHTELNKSPTHLNYTVSGCRGIVVKTYKDSLEEILKCIN